VRFALGLLTGSPDKLCQVADTTSQSVKGVDVACTEGLGEGLVVEGAKANLLSDVKPLPMPVIDKDLFKARESGEIETSALLDAIHWENVVATVVFEGKAVIETDRMG
jgi:hypothetical protein